MSILIGLAIILGLMLSESRDGSASDVRCYSNFALLISLWLSAPLFAFTQVRYFRRLTIETDEGLDQIRILVRWCSWAHSTIWFLSCLSIIGLFGWPDIVREVWKLDRVPLLDELVILLPMITSLVVSWFILFDLKCSTFNAPPVAPVLTRERFDYVSIRCKVYLLVVLIPVAVMVAIKDSWSLFEYLPTAVPSLLVIVVIVAMFCLMPLMIGTIWNHRSITEIEGRSGLLELCDAHRLRVSDIRVWDTGKQAVNALVVGILPKFRLLIVSDLLLESFPENELRAILRHEAGHIRMQHLPTRIGFILLPTMALVALELDANRTLEMLCMQLILSSGFEINPSLLIGLGFLAYVVLVTAWLSKKMEFEADLYATGALPTGNTLTSEVDPEIAQSMANALRRFAQFHPEQFNRRSMTHPSLFDRITLIRTVQQSPKTAVQLRRRFLTEQFLLATAILLATVLLLLSSPKSDSFQNSTTYSHVDLDRKFKH